MTKTIYNETEAERHERLKGWRYEARNPNGNTATMISANFPKHYVADRLHDWVNAGFDVHLVKLEE